ncbi:MAG: diguanylate cyclase, partial [Nitriliruptoraceae bacterium]
VNPALCELLGRSEPLLREVRFVHASGRVLYTQVSAALARDDDGTPLHTVVQIVDLSNRRALEEELRAAASEDPLTGVANRRGLAVRVDEARRYRKRDGRDIGLVFLDLDGFKAVNDEHGHDVGDRVLVATTNALVAATRGIDTVCRIGGDEFVLLCADVDGQQGLDGVVAR